MHKNTHQGIPLPPPTSRSPSAAAPAWGGGGVNPLCMGILPYGIEGIGPITWESRNITSAMQYAGPAIMILGTHGLRKQRNKVFIKQITCQASDKSIL